MLSVPRCKSQFQPQQIFFDNMEIGPANAAGNDAKQNVSGLKLRARNILNLTEG